MRAFVVLVVDGHLCAIKRDGYHILPGGRVEPGESAAQACAREVREEVGIDVVVGDLVAERTTPPLQRYFAVTPLAEVPRHQIVVATANTYDPVEWIPLGELDADVRPRSIARLFGTPPSGVLDILD